MDFRIVASVAFVPALALAQPPAAPDPADARAEVPALRYESSIPRERAPDAKPGDWKRLIEEVGRLGGHAGHLKSLEKQSPASTPGSATKPAAKDAPSGGHSHKH